MSCARETTLTLFVNNRYVVISPEAENCTHPCAVHKFDTLRHILVIFGRNEEEDQLACHMQETTFTFFVKYLSPLKPKSCAGNKSNTV